MSLIEPGRGVVQQTLLEFEVIGPGEILHRSEDGQFLFTKARATLIARAISGKMWLMEHTPYSAPRAFSFAQKVMFVQGRCGYIIQPGVRGWDRYCGRATAPRADYGHCAAHTNQLLAAGFLVQTVLVACAHA